MADVHVLPGVERHDVGVEIPAEGILRQAIDGGMTTVIVLGYGRNGWQLWSSSPDMDKNLGMLSRAQHEVLHCDGVNDFCTEKNEP